MMRPTPKELVQRLLEFKRRRAEEAMRVSEQQPNEINREAWIARAAEIQIVITDLEMMLPYLENESLDLLKRARVKLDASNCDGQLVGPDRDLAKEIDDFLERL